MRVPPNVFLPSQGKCIYCLRTAAECKLTDEHVIPFSFGGHLIIEDGSCLCCAKQTHAIEGHCAGRMFRALRVHHQVPTRRPKERPTHLPVIGGKTPHNAPQRQVAVNVAPGVVVFPLLRPAGIFLGKTPSAMIDIPGYHWYSTTNDAVERQRKLTASGFSGALAYVEFEPMKFARVLAKIAHACVVSRLGTNSVKPFLPKIILGKDLQVSHYVGTGAPVPSALLPPSQNSLHQIGTDTIIIDGKRLIYAQIRLFSHLRPLTPTYTIVVGEFPLI